MAFAQFWSTFELEDNPNWDFLRERYGLRVSSDPDFIFASVFGGGIEGYAEDCVRIGIIYENVRPDFNVFDYALGFDYLQFEDRYLRLPLWVRAWKSIGLPDRSDERLFDREFCSLVLANKQMGGERIEFMGRLSEYREVASGGSVANNIGRSIGPGQRNKIAFCSNYKFNIAFENSSANGYTTEKIVNAFQSGSIPIYAGNPLIARDFNPKAFINCNDFDSIDEVIERVREIDNDKDLYMSMLAEDPLTDEGRAYLEDSYLTDFFDPIFEQGREKARRRPTRGTAVFGKTGPRGRHYLKRALAEALRGNF